MATTTNNSDHHQLINKNHRNEEGEPLCKRTKYNDVCIDLRSSMSYSSEIIADEEKTTKSNIITQNEDAGDSGFQEFNDGSPREAENTDDADNNRSQHQQPTTFSSSASAEFASIHLNQQSHNIQNNDSQEDDDDDLNDIQLQDLGDENDDSESMISDISCLSSLSDLDDGDGWQHPDFGPLSWVQKQITSGTNPRQIIDDLMPNNNIPTSKVDNLTLWKFIITQLQYSLSEPPKRKKLTHVNNIDDVVSLIQKSKKIVVLTGAGISVSSGIPDFRSRDGIYARLSVDFPDLPDPQAMFCINYFRKDQRPFYKFAKEIYPGQFKPSISHKFIKQIESHGKLLRNYTQNIDTLEKSANIDRVITCHGSFSTASCTNCKYQVDGSFVKEDIFAQRIPRCPKCPEDSENLCVLKPDIVFFGESLPEEFRDAMAKDKEECDLLIVIGSSLKVKPVALLPTSIPADVPQILINREHLPHMTFDVELLGDCDIIIQELCHRLGSDWNDICVNEKLKEMKDFNIDEFNSKDEQKQQPQTSNEDESSPGAKRTSLADIIPEDSYVCIPPSRYLFKGAEVYSDSEDDDSSDEDESDQSHNSNSSTSESRFDNSKPLENCEKISNHHDFNGNQADLSKPMQFNSSLPSASSIDTNNNS